MNFHLKPRALAISLLMISGNALAGGYFGIGYGQVDHDYAPFEEPNNLEVQLGLDVDKNIALETSYLEFGDAGARIFGTVARIAINGFTVGAVAKHSISPRLELQAKAGLFFWNLEYSANGFGTIYKEDDSDIFFGFGTMFNVNKQISLGGRYSFYEVFDEDFNVLQAQMKIAFR